MNQTEEFASQPELLTKKEIARHLRVSVRSINSWMLKGKIPFLRITRRCVRFRLKHVLEALEHPQ